MGSSDGTTTVRRHLHVEGAVQGVGFRVGCARAAEQAGVAGWVRNQRDGSVEVVVEGTPAAVGEVVAWCHSGPRGGRVDRVEVADEDPAGEDGFAIIR